VEAIIDDKVVPADLIEQSCDMMVTKEFEVALSVGRSTLTSAAKTLQVGDLSISETSASD
jgi:hypothetical protein